VALRPNLTLSVPVLHSVLGSRFDPDPALSCSVMPAGEREGGGRGSMTSDVQIPEIKEQSTTQNLLPRTRGRRRLTWSQNYRSSPYPDTTPAIHHGCIFLLGIVVGTCPAGLGDSRNWSVDQPRLSASLEQTRRRVIFCDDDYDDMRNDQGKSYSHYDHHLSCSSLLHCV